MQLGLHPTLRIFMRKALSLLVLVAVALNTLPLNSTYAARMGRGAQGWWIGYQGEVCRDGATLAWLWDLPSYGGTRSTLRLWEGAPGSGRLIALAPMSPISHTQAVSFTLDESGTRNSFNIYAIRDVNWWPLLTPGTTFSIEDPLIKITITSTVKNCLLSDSYKTQLQPGQSITLGPQTLRSPSLAIPDDTLRYRITALPLYGNVTLSNTVLVTGSTFYQSDINEGHLKYVSTNTGIQSATDTLGYALDGMVRASLPRNGQGNVEEADGASTDATISANGGVVAFSSSATNLDFFQSDFNGFSDVFVWLGNNYLRRASNNSANNEANNGSIAPALSPNGARVAFTSQATDLVNPAQDCPFSPQDSESQIYRRDLDFDFVDGLVFSPTVRQSASNGAVPNCERGHGTSYLPAVTENGSVAFLSGADNLLTPTVDLDGSISDVFLRGISNTTQRLAPTGATANGFFGVNGFAVAGSGNLTVAVDAADGFTDGDSNGASDIFVQSNGQLITATRSITGGVANGDSSQPALSRDGRWVAFESIASNLVANDSNNLLDVFVRDLRNNSTQLASTTPANAASNGVSSSPRLSADGRWLTFASNASNLVLSDTNGTGDVFVRDMQNGITYLVSQPQFTATLVTANGTSALPSISSDGHHIVFQSTATNLVQVGAESPTDVDNDIFIRYFDPQRTLTIRLSTPSTLYLPILRAP